MEQPPSCSSDPPISGRENTKVTEGVFFWGTSCDGTAAAERPSKGWGVGGGEQTVGCWESVKMSEKRDGARVN